ncbi:unnamed protein product [Caenorhabditis sp. 36 PRJEB53466]|nr:unnamed protein product [Caenorhabditis sp. 36 PRJEB53466]
MRLVEIGALATDSDLSQWRASCETVSHQIGLKLARNEGGLMEIFNAVVASLPRSSDVFRCSAISSNGSLESARRSLIEALTKTVPILLENGWKKSADYKKHALIDSFSLLEEPDASRILKMALENRAITDDDVEEYFALFDKRLERLLMYGKPQFEAATSQSDRAKYANLCVEVLVAVGTCVRNAQKITDLLERNAMKTQKMWMTRLPETHETVTNSFDYPTLFDVATALEHFPLRKVFAARTFATDSLVNVFVEMAPGTKYKVRETVRHELEKASRFVGHAAELGHEAIMLPFSPKVAVSIEDARRRLEVETIERLRKCGYLEHLGAPPDDFVKAQIASIQEILTHCSPQFIHLALRHFSYDTETTIASLLSPESLPIELRRLEHTELRAGVGSGEWPPLDFTAADEIEKSARAEKRAREEEHRRKNEQKPAMNLFSLAPILSDRPPTPPTDAAADLRVRAESYRTTVLAKLEKMRADATVADSKERLAADAENLVPMWTSKKFSALNSLKISEADRVAIRPTYDKYRYETPGDDEVYDDEYDDEFDAREFNVERLNEELASSSDEETAPPPQTASHRGGRGNGTGRGGGRGRGAESGGYTGGRDRQQKERHKSDYKQRGNDRKQRGGGPVH